MGRTQNSEELSMFIEKTWVKRIEILYKCLSTMSYCVMLVNFIFCFVLKIVDKPLDNAYIEIFIESE